jgi:hypothetical protein
MSQYGSKSWVSRKTRPVMGCWSRRNHGLRCAVGFPPEFGVEYQPLLCDSRVSASAAARWSDAVGQSYDRKPTLSAPVSENTVPQRTRRPSAERVAHRKPSSTQ